MNWDKDVEDARAAMERAFLTADTFADTIDELDAQLLVAKIALRKIADFSEADVVKYIQGVDAIALDALAKLEGRL